MFNIFWPDGASFLFGKNMLNMPKSTNEEGNSSMMYTGEFSWNHYATLTT